METRLKDNGEGRCRGRLMSKLSAIAVVSAVAGILSGGCGLVNDPEPDKIYPDAPAVYRIGLEVSVPDNSGKRATRATYGGTDGGGHEQVESYFPDMYECALNPGDVAVYIFARRGSGNYSLIYDSSDDEGFRIIGSPLTGYSVLSTIPFENYRLDLAGLSQTSTVDLRLVALANRHTELSGGTGGEYPYVKLGTDYDEAMTQISDNLPEFTLPSGWNPGNTVAGEPRYIPMFGQADCTVNALEFYHSESWQTVSMEDVMMLRSLAKIEINDNIDNREATEDRYPRIESATLDYKYSTGKLLPYNFSGYTNGAQVEKVNLGSAGDRETRIMTLITGTYYGDGAEAGKRVRFFRGYCPEQMIERDGLPEVNITIKPAASSSEDEYSHYTVPLYGYNGGEFSWGTNNQLLRNHIYRINVNSVGTPADITVQVMPWESEEITWDYTDNPGFADGGQIQWVAGTYNSIDMSTARLIVNPVADGAAVCSFHMIQPQGATWRAYLIDTEGETQGAFHFVDEEGNRVDVPQGNVGEEAVLRILPSQTAQTFTNAARLQILVTTADGTRTIIADVLNGQYGDNTYFTIVQNGTGN